MRQPRLILLIKPNSPISFKFTVIACSLDHVFRDLGRIFHEYDSGENIELNRLDFEPVYKRRACSMIFLILWQPFFDKLSILAVPFVTIALKKIVCRYMYVKHKTMVTQAQAF